MISEPLIHSSCVFGAKLRSKREKECLSNQRIENSCLANSPTVYIQLFRERLSEKVRTTIPKGIVGGFEFTVLQRKLIEWHERPWNICLRVVKESNKSRFDGCKARNSVLRISHITFRDCRVHISSDNLSRNSCIHSCTHLITSSALNDCLLVHNFQNNCSTECH